MKKLLFLILIAFLFSCGNNSRHKLIEANKQEMELYKRLETGLHEHYKNDSIIQFQAFELGYRMAYFNMLSGKFKSYTDFEKQWRIDSAIRVKKITVFKTK